MPPLPVIPNVFRVAWHWSGPSGISAVNVMHFECPAGFPLSVIVEALDDAVLVNMFAWTASTCFVDDITVTPLDGLTASESFAPPTPAKWVGGGLGEALPAVAGIVKLQTGLRGRSHRGRVFIPFVGEGEITVGTLIDVAAVETAWTAFTAALASDTPSVVMGVASYKLSTFSALTAVTAELLAATQRRRQDRLR
jgi:hypothetical protein